MSGDVLERADDYLGTFGDSWKNGEVHTLVAALAAEVRELRDRLSDADDHLQGATGLTPGDQIKINDALAAMGEAKGE